MLFHLFHILSSYWSAFNVIHYITFRSMVSLLSALFISFTLSPWLIKLLRTKQMGQVVRDDGPKSHFSKAGTPTMGGALIIAATLIPALLWVDLRSHFFWSCAIIFVGYGALGFWDDYLKVSKKNTRGVAGRKKLLVQFALAAVVMIYHYLLTPECSQLTVPFFKNAVLELGWLYIPFAMLVIVGASNAVNLTDGLDGLAIGPVMISSACYALLSYISGHAQFSHYLGYPFVSGSGELSISCAAIIGASLGFLWYNTYPAQVFMGDVGSLPLGGILGVIAVFSKHELLFLVIGGVFVVEALSVMTQVASFKLTGKRIFRMAPLHHHFELKGWPEPKVIVRFWIISIILALFALLTLKIR